jgi:hypothetical protein
MAKRRVVAANSVQTEGEGYWVVALDQIGCKSAAVQAASEAEAIEEYKKVMGIRNSIHEFKATYMPDGIDHLETDDFGVIIGEVATSDGDDE